MAFQRGKHKLQKDIYDVQLKNSKFRCRTQGMLDNL